MVLDALERRGCSPRRSGDSWSFKCPAHDDLSPSGSVSQPADKVLLHCHAGCSTEAIVSELQLPMSALFEPWSRNDKGKREIVATYPYVDENGELVSETVKYFPRTSGNAGPMVSAGGFGTSPATSECCTGCPR